MKRPPALRKYLAEGIGAFILVLFNCGVVAVSGCDGTRFNGAYVMSALGFGLVIVTMSYAIGGISGSHINPAVSLAMLVCRRLTARDCIGYILAQLFGATAGAAALSYFIGSRESLGQNSLYEGDVLKSLVIETVLTFVYVLTVLGVSARIRNRSVAGLAAGGALALVHLFGIYFTGTSVNPARSFGPALLAGGAAIDCLWVFLVAPSLGGLLAALAHRYVLSPAPPTAEETRAQPH